LGGSKKWDYEGFCPPPLPFPLLNNEPNTYNLKYYLPSPSLHLPRIHSIKKIKLWRLRIMRLLSYFPMRSYIKIKL
jgi:hypothetical protein